MTKNEFLSELSARLSQLPQSEIYKSTGYYAEMIDDRMEDGVSEEEAVAGLGDIDAIAGEIMLDAPLPMLVKSRMQPKTENKSAGRTAVIIVLLVLGFPVWFPILAAVLGVVIAVYAVIWAVIISVFAVVVSLVAGGLASFVASGALFAGNAASGILMAAAGFVSIGLCLFMFLAARELAKGLIKLTTAFGRWLKSLFIKKEVL